MSREIDVLLSRVEDPSLRADLRTQFDRAASKRRFGLVFEDHLPERVRLPGHPVRSGVNAVLRADPDDNDLRHVTRVRNGKATLLAGGGTTEQVAVDELVVVAEFGQTIHPGLRHLGSVHRGGDKSAHVVIKGENHHALELLQFTHAGKVDCIYIDPPYNTGARDWKYDNNYVDDNDAYRHSKWLAFMNRRLRLAKQLLNPANSVLIVTIDEKEVHRLGLLLDQVFPGCDIQTVTVVTNHAGSLRKGRFTRVEEYVFFVFLGSAVVSKWETRMLASSGAVAEARPMPTVWFTAVRTGTGGALRANRTTPVLFYPIHLNAATGSLHSVGEPLPMGEDIADYKPPAGTIAVWPLHSDGTEQTWRFSGPQMRERFHAGTARLGRRDPETGHRPVTYLRPGTLGKIENGEFVVTGRDSEGALVIGLADGQTSGGVPPAAVWHMTGHFARNYGTGTLRALLPNRAFPFPKSLYVVEDTLRVAVGDKPDAVILDFFAGSGTTAHAVARLNRQDGGRRQSISVTNNEVSDAEARQLRKAGHLPGDAAWEALGIFEHVTRPRIEAAVTGLTPDGEPVKGDYKFTDEFPMAEGFEENVEFFELTYLDPEDVELDLAFEGIAPLLWMRAGCAGLILTGRTDSKGRPVPYLVGDRYGVLFDTDRWRRFVDALPDSAAAGFVVTDSASVFAGVAAELPGSLDLVRLYENYLSTFAINQGR